MAALPPVAVVRIYKPLRQPARYSEPRNIILKEVMSISMGQAEDFEATVAAEGPTVSGEMLINEKDGTARSVPDM